MTTIPFLNQLRARILAIRAQTSTASPPRVFENLDRCIKEIDDALFEEATRTNVTLDVNDLAQRLHRPGRLFS